MAVLKVSNYKEDLQEAIVRIEISGNGNVNLKSDDLIAECKLFKDTFICRILIVFKQELFVHTNIKAVDGMPSSCLLLNNIEYRYNDNSWQTTKECDVLNTSSNTWQLVCKGIGATYKNRFDLYLHCGNNIQFKDIYDDRAFTDFKLYGENDGIEAAVSVHRNVLTVSSPVLKSMLLGDWKEAKQGNIRLPFVTKNTLQHFKEYIYLQQMPNMPIDCAKLMCLASYFMLKQLPKLEKEVSEHVAKVFEAENVWEWIDFCIFNKNNKLLLMLLEKIEETKGNFINQFISRVREGPYKSVFELKRICDTSKKYDLYDDKDCIDFELRSGDDSKHSGVEVHRNVMAAFSPVLKELFLNEWKDASHGYVQPNDVSQFTLQDFKDYVYMQKVPDNSMECAELITLASSFKIPELERDAALKIADNLQPDNIWEWFEYCVDQKNDYLLVSILRNIYEHNKIVSIKKYFTKKENNSSNT